MHEIIITVVIVVGLCLILTVIVLGARLWLINTGVATITINERQQISADLGDKLLWALASNSIILPTACGGRGSCGQCRVRIEVGGGQCLPNEETLITARDRLAGDRLACMVTIRNDLSIQLPESILNTKQLQCSVRSSRNITNYLRELILEPVGDNHLSFRAGDYLVVEAPPGQSNFIDFDIDEAYADEWRQLGLTDLTVTRKETQLRAYSFANAPADQDTIMLIVRIALPPASLAAHVPPGQVSSFLYGLRAGDQVSVSGPFGEFHANESNAEMVIIGGGAGIAPLRAIIHDQLLTRKSSRTISFWYGARNISEVCYQDEFDSLASRFKNFSWQVALSEVEQGTDWPGPRGFIHAVIYDQYLSQHAAPEKAEYYLCGPPLMNSAVIAMLEDIGVPTANIYFDNFGAT